MTPSYNNSQHCTEVQQAFLLYQSRTFLLDKVTLKSFQPCKTRLEYRLDLLYYLVVCLLWHF